ncbi:MAG: methylmalonyl-CoA decarboxylase [Coprothermobacterota bacterium]|nr:methylmalonyl-CoA decarboxylase [Coprothermobacterota bacterium]
MPLILEENRDDVGILILNHDAKRNALNRIMMDNLTEGLERMKANGARVVILRANRGAAVWSAGHDIAELPKPGFDPLAYDDPLEKTIRSIQHFPAPVIAMIEGTVWGGACELALTCDIRIGTPQTSFAVTPAKIGLPYNLNGITNLVNALGAATAREMAFTAQPLPAERAYQLGILQYLVAAEELESFTLDLARKITLNSPLSISVIKEQLHVLSGAYAISPETFERVQALRKVAYESTDYQEGIDAFFQKRTPRFHGK